MELLLIRHARPVRVELDSGRADPELGPEGRDQAVRLARWLARDGVDAVVSSPLRRARQTAEPVAEACGRAVEVRDGLAEFDRDSPFYIPLEELRAEGDPRFADIMQGRWDAFGVDVAEFRAQVVEAVESVIADHPGRNVAVVTHGGVINAYVAHVVASARTGVFTPEYTSVSRILAARSGERTIRTLNETAPPV